MTSYLAAILTAVIATATCVIALGVWAIAFAHWRDARRRADYDGMEFDEPRKQHPIWRDEQ